MLLVSPIIAMIMKEFNRTPEQAERAGGIQWLLKNDIHKLMAVSDDPGDDIDKSVHEIRKALKSILAILLLFKPMVDKNKYAIWRSDFKAISKQFASFREPYVLLQTFHKLKEDIANIDKIRFIELKKHFEAKHNELVKDNKDLVEAIKQLKNSVLSISEAIDSSNVYSDMKWFKKRYRKIFQKTRPLFHALTLDSSPEDFHEFRKVTRSLYFQQAAIKDLEPGKVSLTDARKLHKLTEHLGNEHDLQLFYRYLKEQFPEMYENIQPFLLVRIKKLRKKAMILFPSLTFAG